MAYLEVPSLAPLLQNLVPGPKRPYEPPKLIVFGDLRTLTLGPSPGIGESGNPALFKSR
ncbi:MAG TPA: lasso RiPP family leader peptide-containing protein [Thermoanaerobaculia bacterium]|nr:lasso RiPP family leader peptide-containing protein [Thermoanaerobaculia bacterium]